jgi:hypothetical protein
VPIFLPLQSEVLGSTLVNPPCKCWHLHLSLRSIGSWSSESPSQLQAGATVTGPEPNELFEKKGRISSRNYGLSDHQAMLWSSPGARAFHCRQRMQKADLVGKRWRFEFINYTGSLFSSHTVSRLECCAACVLETRFCHVLSLFN